MTINKKVDPEWIRKHPEQMSEAYLSMGLAYNSMAKMAKRNAAQRQALQEELADIKGVLRLLGVVAGNR